jgi:hypothetical protein
MIDEIKFKTSGVHIKLSGVITSKQILNANTELVRHPDFGTFKYQLWHLDPIEDFILSAREIQKIANQDIIASDKNSQIKLCFVSSSPLASGIGSMWQAFYGGGPWEVKFFYDIAEAETWIGL